MPSPSAPQVQLSIVALVLLVTGCATTAPQATPEMDARAKSFTVAQGKANIYLYRNENLSADPMSVSVNGKQAGATGRSTYFLWEVDPGTYDISADVANTATAHIVAESGKSYYVWQQIKVDRRWFLLGIVTAGSDLRVVDDVTGRWGVSECTRLQSRL